MAERPFAERLWEGIDETLEGYDIPSEFGEMLKKDLKDALTAKGRYRPGYEPGAVGYVGLNLIDAVTEPGKTARKLISSFTSELSRPPIPLAWTDAESTVWQRAFDAAGVDLMDRPLIPRSLQDATLRWNERARLRVTRLIAEEKGIRQSPGLTLMMAQRLGAVIPGMTVEGVPLSTIINEASQFEANIAGYLQAGDWEGAGAAQTAWFHRSKPYREKLIKEFERQSRLRQDVASSPEAQFWRYWKNRNLYFQTLNFLNTWRKEGFWGMAKVYAWNWAILKTFGAKPVAGAAAWAKLRYYSYPAHVLTWVQEKTVGRLLQGVLTKLTDWRQRLKNWWKRKVKDRLTKGLEFIRDRIIRQAARWLITKLGLKVVLAKIGAAIGGAIGTAAGPVGSAVGAVIGAVVSFIGGIVAEKMMKPVLKGTVYLFAGSCGCLAIAIGGAAIGLPILVASIFAPGAGGPGAGPPLPPVAQVTVEKKVCYEKLVLGEPEWFCVYRHTIGNNTGVHEIRWEITVTNGSDQTAEVTVSDTECGQTWTYSLSPGQSNVPGCTRSYNTNDPTLHNTTIVNTVSGTATVGSDTRPLSTTGILIIGTPAATFPSGWPTSGTITQGPNVPCPSHGSAEAIDIANAAGTPIFATHSGRAVQAGEINASCGDGVRITATVGASTFTSQYCHMESVAVSEGAQISDGQQIGLMDSTGDSSGSHLHYSFIGLPMAPPYIPQAVCCCREDLDEEGEPGYGSWEDEDELYCGSSSPSTVRCNASVSH